MKRFIVPGLIVVLVLVGGLVMFTGGTEPKHLTAHFPRTVSVYEGSDVRVLGVPIGRVEKVTPSGTDVIVKMSYDPEVNVPADVKAVIVAPSVVGDRYVQLTPAYERGPKLADGAVLTTADTSVPLELDEIYDSLDRLVVALGPQGANKTGALNALLDSTAQNFSGQGEKFHQTIKDLGKLTGTLSNNREELFGAAARIESFLNTLAKNDKTVRQFNDSLASISGVLAGERQELAASLKNLSVAMAQVSTFVRDNQAILGRNIKGLNNVVKVLVRQRKSLDEVLRVAPVALVNLAQAYNPQAGTLDTRANLGELLNQLPASPTQVLCSLVQQKTLCDALGTILPRAGADAIARPHVASYDPTLGGLVEVTP